MRKTKNRPKKFSLPFWQSAAVLGALVFAALGATLLLRSFAATNDIAAEAEAGTIAGNAAIIDDPAASAGKAVKYGSAATVPSGTVKIMPLGSSTIEGERGSSTGAGFRPELYQVLTGQEGMDADFVGSKQNGPTENFDRDHEGHGGWVIGTGSGDKDLSQEIVGWLNTYQPDIILFYAGFNDVNGGTSGAETAERFDAFLGKVFDTLPNVRFIAANAMVPFAYDEDRQAEFRAFNDGMEPVAAKYRGLSHYVQVVDLNAIITEADHSDDIHANDAGYHKMVPMWLEAIRATYPTF